MRLMVFIKIILKCLETDDPSVRLEAKRVIAECTKKNREGHPDYIPLEDAIRIAALRMDVEVDIKKMYLGVDLSNTNALYSQEKPII